MWLVALVSLAMAQSSPVSVDDEDILEITVWGRLAIKQAEDDVVRKMEAMGYRTKRKDGQVVFKPPRGWMGTAIFEEGILRFRRPAVGLQLTPEELYEIDVRRQRTLVGPDGREMNPYLGAGPSFWVLPSKKKLGTINDAVADEVRAELKHYQAVSARTHLEEKLLALPDRLDRLWEEGEALEATSEPLDTPEQRRAHVLAYWVSRPDSPSGRRVCEVVHVWLTEVVQASPHPITAQERSRFEALRADGLTLPSPLPAADNSD